MELVWVSDCISDVFDRKLGRSKELYGFAQPEGNKELLRADTDMFPENPAQVVPMDFAGIGDVSNSNFVVKILDNICKCPF